MDVNNSDLRPSKSASRLFHVKNLGDDMNVNRNKTRNHNVFFQDISWIMLCSRSFSHGDTLKEPYLKYYARKYWVVCIISFSSSDRIQQANYSTI